ncbi:MAG: FAD-dependent oxidoreductase, partial [Deltaproteobacteria bacterium]|nr:FAD-dependent oxidoreductase [Deltaproteobacteria bacterium]
MRLALVCRRELEMDQADMTIIGAGVVGLAVAAEVSGPGRSVFILEKNAAHGGGISSRNSEVIHAGLYYPGDSLKARLCITGNRLLYEIAGRSGVPHKKIGKLVVAGDSAEIEEIEKLFENGRENGAGSLSMIGARQVAELEPNVRARAALLSPDTGIIDTHALMNCFLRRAEGNGAKLVCHTRVSRIEKEAARWRIFAESDKGEVYDFLTAVVINAAGLSSDTIANMAGAHYRLHYCKGDYCGVTGVKAGRVGRLIYPAPVP